MKPFDKCPNCGGNLINKKVEKILRGGNNTAIVKVEAEVCLHCGERLYSKETVQMFEEIRKKLKQDEVSSYHPIGQTYEVV